MRTRGNRALDPFDRNISGGLYFINELDGNLENFLRCEGCGFLNEIDCAGFQRVQSGVSVFIGDAHDDYRQRFTPHLLSDETHAVQFRHLEIAGHDVGIQLLRQLQSFPPITRSANNLDKRAAGQYFPHDFPDIRGVVDYEHAQYTFLQSHLLVAVGRIRS